MPQPPDAITNSVLVRAPLEEAFATFVDRLGAWWPRQFTFSEDDFEVAIIEPQAGRRWFERDRGGEELEWGEVRAWEPPHRIPLSWRVGPDRTQEEPDRASEVEVRFAEAGPSSTEVTVIHCDFAKHGHGGEEMRAGMASEQDWPGLLERYRREVLAAE